MKRYIFGSVLAFTALIIPRANCADQEIKLSDEEVRNHLNALALGMQNYFSSADELVEEKRTSSTADVSEKGDNHPVISHQEQKVVVSMEGDASILAQALLNSEQKIGDAKPTEPEVKVAMVSARNTTHLAKAPEQKTADDDGDDRDATQGSAADNTIPNDIAEYDDATHGAANAGIPNNGNPDVASDDTEEEVAIGTAANPQNDYDDTDEEAN